MCGRAEVSRERTTRKDMRGPRRDCCSGPRGIWVENGGGGTVPHCSTPRALDTDRLARREAEPRGTYPSRYMNNLWVGCRPLEGSGGSTSSGLLRVLSNPRGETPTNDRASAWGGLPTPYRHINDQGGLHLSPNPPPFPPSLPPPFPLSCPPDHGKKHQLVRELVVPMTPRLPRHLTRT